MPKIILFSGKARAGKDLGAQFLAAGLKKQDKRVIILHYADVLKFVATKWYGYDGDKSKPEMRSLLQHIGTEVFRVNNPGCWVRIVKELVLGMGDSVDYVLIPDCRFEDEATWPAQAGLESVILRIERPGFDNGLSKEQKEHPSETSLDSYPMDLYIKNNYGAYEYQQTMASIAGQVDNLFMLKAAMSGKAKV